MASMGASSLQTNSGLKQIYPRAVRQARKGDAGLIGQGGAHGAQLYLLVKPPTMEFMGVFKLSSH